MQEYTTKNLTKTNITAEQGKKDLLKAGVDVAKDTAYLYGAKVLTKPVALAIGGTLGGFLHKAFGGKDPYEAAGLAIGEMPKYEAVANVTDAFLGPAIAKAKGILANPASKQIIGRTLSGLNSVIQNEIVSKMDKKDPTAYENLLAFGMGAILSSGGSTKEWDSLSKDTKDLIQNGGKKLGLDMRKASEVWAMGEKDVGKNLPNFLYEAINKGNYNMGLSVKAKGTGLTATEARNTIESSKTHQKGLIDAMKGSNTQDEAVVGIKQYLDDQLAKLSENPNPKEAKGLRAAINRTMYNLAGVDPKAGLGETKPFMASFDNPDIAQALQTLEGYKTQVDDVIAGKIKQTGTVALAPQPDTTLPSGSAIEKIGGMSDFDQRSLVEQTRSLLYGKDSAKPNNMLEAKTLWDQLPEGNQFKEGIRSFFDRVRPSKTVAALPVEGGKIIFDPSRLEKNIMPPETGGNPGNQWEAQIRYKGFAADKKSFNTKQQAEEFLKNYEFKGLSTSVHEDYKGTSFDPFVRTRQQPIETGTVITTPPLSPAENIPGGGVQPQPEVKPQTTGARKAEDIISEVYHGTDQTTLDKYGNKLKDRTFFTTDKNKAQKFAEISGKNPVVVGGKMNLTNFENIKTDAVSYQPSDREIQAAIENGKEGFVIVNGKGDKYVLPFNSNKQLIRSRPAADIISEIQAGTYKPRTKRVQAAVPVENVVPTEIKTPIEAPAVPGEKPFGFVKSVQESPNISAEAKAKVTGTYTPKPNTELMGEAQALLQDGASINFKGTKNLDQKVAATIQEALNLDKVGQHDAAANLYNNLKEHGLELGRGVQAFSLLNKMSPEAIALSAAGKIKQYNMTAIKKIPELSGDQVKTISDMVSKIDGLTGRDKNIAINNLKDTIDEFIPSSFVDKAITVWKAGLLTSLRTHERNLLGNTIMGGSEVAKDLPAAFADKIMSLKTGKRSMTFTTKGTGAGAKKGLQSAKDIIQTGYDPEDAISKYDVKKITWGKGKVEQALKKYTDVVFRTLGGADKPFWNSSFARSLYDQAGAEAINAGKQGDSAFIEALVKTPTEEMLKTATIDANTATFHDKNVLTAIASAVKRTAKDPRLGWGAEVGKVITEVLMPFTGVPSSIVGKTITYSPIGLINGSVKVGRILVGQIPELQRQAAQEVGRGVIGTGLFGIGAYLMSKGLMTGQPKDAKEADLWATQGKQANSVLLPGLDGKWKWRSIGSIGPQNLVMLAGAKYQEEMGSPEGSLGKYGASLAKDQLSQTFLAGVQQPLNAITDPARYGKSYVGNLGASTIPNIVKDASKAFDPNVRENNTVTDYLKSGIPGLRNTLTPKRDVLGNEIKQEPTGAGAFFDLFNSKTPIDNVIVNELARLAGTGNEATPSRQTATQTIRKEKIKLTFEQLNQLEKGVGEALKPQLETLIQSDTYQNLADDAKAKAIDNLVANVRTKYKNVNGQDLTVGNPAEPGAITPTNQGYSYVDAQGNYKEINIQKVADMPETSRYEKTLKEKAAFTLVDDILDNLPTDQQPDALTKIGMDPTAASYYNVARQTDDAKYAFVLDQIDVNGADRPTMLKMLVQGRTTINNKMLVSNSVVDDLYNAGYISSAERTQLKKITIDSQGKQTRSSAAGTGAKAKAFTMDKLPEISKFIGASSSKAKPIALKPLSADFFAGQPKIAIPKPKVLTIEDLIRGSQTQPSGVAKAKLLIAKSKQGRANKTGSKLSKAFFSGNRKQS